MYNMYTEPKKDIVKKAIGKKMKSKLEEKKSSHKDGSFKKLKELAKK